MNKKTQMYLGIGVVAVAAYYFWMKSKTPAKANLGGKVPRKPFEYGGALNPAHDILGNRYYTPATPGY